MTIMRLTDSLQPNDPPPPSPAGTGKTQLALSLLDDPSTADNGRQPSGTHPVPSPVPAGTHPPQLYVDPFEGSTRAVSVLRGTMHGITATIIDTPGLCPSPSQAVENHHVLRQIRRWAAGLLALNQALANLTQPLTNLNHP